MKIHCKMEVDRMKAMSAIMNAELPMVFTVAKPRSKRSLEQNDMLHGIFQVIADHTGYTLEEIKEVAMSDLGYVEIKSVLGRHIETRVSTSKMNTEEMSELIERVLAWASERGLPTMRDS